MRALTLFLAVILVTLASSKVSASVSRRPAADETGKTYSCRIVTGYGTAVGQGPSKLKAKEKAWEKCGDQMIDDYLARRGSIPDEVVADLTTACINKDCQ